MRPIDADELKKCAFEVYQANGVALEPYMVVPLGAIDKAPTVPLPDFKEGYKQAILDGKTSHYTILFNSKPEGEWIYGEDDCGQDGWFCSECNFFVPWYYEYYEKDINFIREYKVCPHCLAEMVSYTGKDREKKGEEK